MIDELEQLAEELHIENIEEEIDLLMTEKECGCGHDWSFIKDREDAEVVLYHVLESRKRGMLQGIKISNDQGNL